jgi:ABC-type nitrate/sulfonate/bicarbonate transport system ATPase subunit
MGALDSFTRMELQDKLIDLAKRRALRWQKGLVQQ